MPLLRGDDRRYIDALLIQVGQHLFNTFVSYGRR